MAAKLRPRVMLPRFVSTSDARAAEARGRQLQRLVGRRVTAPPHAEARIRPNECTDSGLPTTG